MRLWETIKCLFTLWTKNLSKCEIPKPISNKKEWNLVKDLINESSLILNFNYTETIERHFWHANCNILHIHGNCKHPIIGHSFEDAKEMYEEFENRKLQSLYVNRIKNNSDELNYQISSSKNTYGIYERAKNEYSIWFDKIKNIRKIIFFGLSYSEVDWPYYKYLKNDYFKKGMISPVFYYFPKKNDKHPSYSARRFAKYLYRINLISKSSMNNPKCYKNIVEDKNYKYL